MISSLADLVAPLTEAEFLKLLRTRTMTLQRGTDGNRYKDLPSWQALRDLLDSGTLRQGDFRVTSKTELVPQVFYFANGRVRPEAITTLLNSGASVIFRHLERHFPALGALCRDIAERTSETSLVDAVATSGTGGALRFHYDVEDMFVVQLEGSKRWKVHDERIINPVVGAPALSEPHNPPILDEVLHPGDTLFLPAGYTHHCVNGPELSLHLVVCLTPATGYYAVKSLLSRLAQEDLFRMPLSRVPDTDRRSELEARIKQRLSELMDETSWLDPGSSEKKY
jgi:lysine-specific demethylase/histidyl-hydroxylase NO66